MISKILTSATSLTTVYSGELSRNAQYEQYGRTYKLGLKFTLY